VLLAIDVAKNHGGDPSLLPCDHHSTAFRRRSSEWMRLQILNHAHGGDGTKTLEFSCPLNGGWYRSSFHSLIAPFGEEPFCCHGGQIQSFDLERGCVFFRLLSQVQSKPTAAISRIDRKGPEKPESADGLHPPTPC